MSTETVALGEGPACVVRLLGKLERVACDTEDDVALGPYLVDALINDVALCPALQLEGHFPSGAGDRLATTLERAHRAAALVRKCPSMQRDWAVEQLQTAVESARDVMKERQAAVAAEGTAIGVSAFDSVLKSERCAICPFA
jgi:hypothetical protein